MNVLITGHTSGIGLELQKIFTANDCKVYGISRRTSLFISNENQFGCDLSSIKGIKDACDWVEPLQLDCVIHCAGSNKINSFIDTELLDYQESLNLHTLSISQILRKVLPNMISINSGKIILISSICSKISA